MSRWWNRVTDADSEVVTLLTVRTTEGLEGVDRVMVWNTHAPGRGGAAEAVRQDTRVCGDRVVDVSFGEKRPG